MIVYDTKNNIVYGKIIMRVESLITPTLYNSKPLTMVYRL